MIFHRLPLELAIQQTVAGRFDALELWPPQIAESRNPEIRTQLVDHIHSPGPDVWQLHFVDCDYFQAISPINDVPPALAG